MNQKSQAKKITATLAAALPLALAAGIAFAQTGPAGQSGLSAEVAQTGQMPPAAPTAQAAQAPQPATTGLALAQQQNCMSCHSVNRAFMGPALRDVAAKYASKPDAQAYLAHKIMEGSSGVWGTVPMPANTQLNPGQAAALARWILTLK